MNVFHYCASGSGAECKNLNRLIASVFSIKPNCCHWTVPCASPGAPVGQGVISRLGS